MLPLPEKLPRWYTVEQNKERGWTPETKHIINKSINPEDRGEETTRIEVINSWKNDLKLQNSETFTIRTHKLQIISPIQVGGVSLFEGGILPAQISGLPYIPGSSIRGALLRWIKHIWEDMPCHEKQFWQNLIAKNPKNRWNWKPRKIRFENVYLKDLIEPFPLHAQQKWQIFINEQSKLLNETSRILSIQWQVIPTYPDRVKNKLHIQILLKANSIPILNEQKVLLEYRIKEMLQHQGIGRGKASGFGRLAISIPSGSWTISLIGMKPCIQQKNEKQNQKGKYRWSPQVLRANLRGYFTRLALSLLGKENALKLTDRIFGGLNSPAQLILTSYLQRVEPNETVGKDLQRKYKNIEAEHAHSTWLINVDCNNEFKDLIGGLLNLSSRLGGLGAGWRRPPHELKEYCYRGSQFTVTPSTSEKSIQQLIKRLQEIIIDLAHEHCIPILHTSAKERGSIISIWQGTPGQWREIVHGVCRSKDNSKNPNPDRPNWCGTTEYPSMYTVRQHQNYCLITVFDRDVEAILECMGFKRVWI